MRVRLQVWSPKAGHRTFAVNAPSLSEAIAKQRQRMGSGEIRATRWKGKA